MKRIVLLMMLLVVAVGVFSQSTGKSPSGKVEIVKGYLYVYPQDLGSFNVYPKNVIETINDQKRFGYDNWRLPTQEELSLMVMSRSKLGMGNADEYMTIENANPSSSKNVRLVRIARKNRGTKNGHEWVDLGLPSGTLWATCNLGAAKPEDFGKLYAWGETSTKEFFDWTNYRFGTHHKDYMSAECCWRENDPKELRREYDMEPVGWGMDLKPEYDAATVNWGEEWITPDYYQWQELKQYCKRKWTTNGCVFTGPSGNSIFLPASKRDCNGNVLPYGEINGHYWTRSLEARQRSEIENGESPRAHGALIAYHQGLFSTKWVFDFGFFGFERYNGCVIRPICRDKNEDAKIIKQAKKRIREEKRIQDSIQAENKRIQDSIMEAERIEQQRIVDSINRIKKILDKAAPYRDLFETESEFKECISKESFLKDKEIKTLIDRKMDNVSRYVIKGKELRKKNNDVWYDLFVLCNISEKAPDSHIKLFIEKKLKDFVKTRKSLNNLYNRKASGERYSKFLKKYINGEY